jgi:hypothetical protein
MLRNGSRIAGLGVGIAGWLAVLTSSADAEGGTFQQCVDQAIDHNGEPPTCTMVNGRWVASWPDDSAAGGGIAPLLIIGVLLTAATVVWKVSTAQKLARQSGMDPSLATQMTLLTDDGLEATYLAANLRPSPSAAPASTVAPSAAAASSRSVADRLKELSGLLDQGMVTRAEYDERRRAILDEV